MPSITLKNIPESLYERLKYLSKLRHRSLNSEMIYNLEKAVGLAEEDPEQLREETGGFRDRLCRNGEFSAEEIEKAIDSARP
jgi:hypothetical protein